MAIYSKDGKFISQNTADANQLCIGDSAHPISKLTADQFRKIASVVKQEGATNEAMEYMCIAHALFNESGAVHKSMYDLAMSSYSSVPHIDALSDSDQSGNANSARAAVLDTLTGGTDPTNGATFWDGVDFISKGTLQAKFKQYRHITIPQAIYTKYLNAVKAKYPNGVRFAGVKYDVPAPVFTDASHWVAGNFEYETGVPRQPKLIGTIAVGQSIFWKIG